MRDYSLNIEGSKTFILKYEINDNKITVYFANGEEHIIPYSKENEKKLLEKMKEQVLNSGAFKCNQEKKLSKSKSILAYSIGLLLGDIICSIFMPALPLFQHIIIAFILSGFSIFNIVYIFKLEKDLRDIRKNKNFIELEEKLNQFERQNYNVFYNINEKTKEKLCSQPDGQPQLTINSVNAISEEELNQIFANVDREEEFEFNYSSDSHTEETDGKAFTINPKKRPK